MFKMLELQIFIFQVAIDQNSGFSTENLSKFWFSDQILVFFVIQLRIFQFLVRKTVKMCQ